MKYTKEPWEIVYRDDEQHMCMTVIAPKDAMGDTRNVCRLCDDPNQDKVIAIVLHQIRPFAGMDAIDRDEDEGNALLIAAAPEMYEALNRLVEYGNIYRYRYKGGISPYEQAKAALEKAKGAIPN